MTKKKKNKQSRNADVWKYAPTGDPVDLCAYERKDRKRAIWTRTGPNEFGEYENVKPLYGPIRDDNGRIDPELETIARALAEARSKEVAAQATVKPRNDGPLTLSRAVQLIMDPKHGKFAGDSDWQHDVERYLKLCITILGDTPVADIKHAHYKLIWRHLADEHNKDSSRYGVRSAEMICGALRSAMTWLAQEEYVEPNTALPAPRWKAQMQAEWVKLTGKPLSDPHKPRYTKEEYAKLWKALPKADPRLRLAVAIGAELRLGQVVERTRRSDVKPHGGNEIGLVIVHGAGKKGGADVVLNSQQRAVMIEAMTTGFLSEMESAYKAGKIDDYLLIAGGHLLNAKTSDPDPKAQPVNAMMKIGKRALRDYWRELEELAGVEHVEGRGWYGVRRRAADDAEDETNDPRVLMKMGGWKDDKTRRRYQDQGRTDIAEKAADVRSRIRPPMGTESGKIQPPDSTIN